MKPIDSAFIHYITNKYRQRNFFSGIDAILPHVVFEIMALGEDALLYVWKKAAKLKLDDGHIYTIGYQHAHHGLVLTRMIMGPAGFLRKVNPPYVITNVTTPDEVWAVLNPEAAKLKGIRKQPVHGVVFVPMATRHAESVQTEDPMAEFR